MSGSRRRRQERDWPTLPIPFFAFRDIYELLARDQWDGIGALPPFELVDQPLVLSALAHPFATAGGEDLYPTVRAKAAALFRGLVKNHGLRDGNKRLAVTVMTAFLLANGWRPTFTNLELYLYALRVARREGNFPLATIENWIRRHTVLAPDADLDFLRAQNLRLHAQADVLQLAFDPILLPPGVIARALAEEAAMAPNSN